MDLYEFYTGRSFHAHEYLGAHASPAGVTFRVFAPNAVKVSLIGEFNDWMEAPMRRVLDSKFYELSVPEAAPGQLYKYRIYEPSGRFLDRADPYGQASRPRPETASVISDHSYTFGDKAWMRRRTDRRREPLNIYEIHAGSWRAGLDNYRNLADPLCDYLLENGYNFVELMPLCEYPADASWGYQALGFFCPTARYGTPDDLKYFVDRCHQRGIGVILDFPITHFAVDDFGLANFDGTPLYEYPHPDVGYNEWGSKNFNYAKGEVRSFLQSALRYWFTEFHFDGIRMDAIRNLIYWQGNTDRGVNQAGIEFLREMNYGLKELDPKCLLIAEDSSAYPGVTGFENDGLGFDYKWDMGWMNDTLDYFRTPPAERLREYHKLTFSMLYFYNESFMLPLSHDEVVHGKATILGKMFGEYEGKFPQARALYLYMYAHPGKKLNFMGNEWGQLREWDETREQDWEILRFPAHNTFQAFIRELNQIYLRSSALWEQDFDRDGFEWLDCKEDNRCYAFLRRSQKQTFLAVFNFGDAPVKRYSLKLPGFAKARPLLDSNWQRFGGGVKERRTPLEIRRTWLTLELEPYSGQLFALEPKP